MNEQPREKDIKRRRDVQFNAWRRQETGQDIRIPRGFKPFPGKKADKHLSHDASMLPPAYWEKVAREGGMLKSLLLLGECQTSPLLHSLNEKSTEAQLKILVSCQVIIEKYFEDTLSPHDLDRFYRRLGNLASQLLPREKSSSE